MNIDGLYTIIDDFFKSLMQEKIWKLIKLSYFGKRGPRPKLSISIDLKTFHKLVINRYSNEFPNMPNYENFLKATNKVGNGLAGRGRSTKGWFYGFKLHGVCNEEGYLEDIMFSSGSPNDNNFKE